LVLPAYAVEHKNLDGGKDREEKPMKKKHGIFFGFAVLIIAVIFTLAGCEDPNGGGGDDDSWPPSSELSTFLLGGWTQPDGISGITWGYLPGTAEMHLQIQFSGASAQTADAINDYLTSNGYPFSYGSPIASGPTHYHSVFENGSDATYNYVVNYTFDVPGGGGIQLMKELKGGGDGGGSSFTISGYTGDITWVVYAHTDANITTASGLLNATTLKATGAIAADGTVTWIPNVNPFTGSYTLYLVKQGGDIWKTPSPITITTGNGTVAYSSFVDVP
jgi:hypothetical protein